MGKVELNVASGEMEPNGKFRPTDSKKIFYDSKVHGRDVKDKDKEHKKTVIDMEK